MTVYVTMIDKFMSGWGEACGKISRFVVECDTMEQALTVKENAKQRGEMVRVSISHTKPYYPKESVVVGQKHFSELGLVWTQRADEE